MRKLDVQQVSKGDGNRLRPCGVRLSPTSFSRPNWTPVMRIVRGLGGTGRIYSDPRHSSLRMGQSVCVWGGGGGGGVGL